MTSMEDYVMKIKPALDKFLRNPDKDNLSDVEKELSKFTWAQMQIFHVQILLPLILKLEKLNGTDQDLQTGTMYCIRFVVSKLYLKDLQGLRTMLIIVLKQIRDCDQGILKPNLSEEIKLAAVETISTILERSTSDLLETYYTQQSALFLGQILLTLVEFIQKEKYKKLVIASLNCLRTVFYVHESSECLDVVLRSQVANTLFIFLPRTITVLFKSCLLDEKMGETLIITAIKALGGILSLMFEDTDDSVITTTINVDSFKQLIKEAKSSQLLSQHQANLLSDGHLSTKTKFKKDQIEERLKQMQTDGRDKHWFKETSNKLRIMFRQIGTLRSHQSVRIRYEYAKMCCDLTQKCRNNLKDNFIFMLENVIAMSEDADTNIVNLCQQTLKSLQCCGHHDNVFDESAELLFDEHLTKLPRIISRCDDDEQYAELLFLKGFFRNVSAHKLQVLFSLTRNLDIFCVCLITATDLKISRDLLVEDYALRNVDKHDLEECGKLHWRQFTNLSSKRCISTVQEICAILGRTKNVNNMIFDYLLEMLTVQTECMNEIILVMLWVATDFQEIIQQRSNDTFNSQKPLVETLLNEILSEQHWHLALQADPMWRLKPDKPTNWFVDRTPGLYESAVEIRMQDCDSDEEDEEHERQNIINIADAQYNVLHSCIVLDALGHCAVALGERFENYLFRSLHRVLLKVGSSNLIIHQSAIFALTSMQRALRFLELTHFIETYTDYITYHMNRILKKKFETKSAVDIMTVVLQFCSSNALPHLDNIFKTIREECGKSYQSENVPSYLRVFLAFLINVSRWNEICYKEFNDIDMQMDTPPSETILFTHWLDILKRSEVLDKKKDNCTEKELPSSGEPIEIDQEEESTQSEKAKLNGGNKSDKILPQHLQVVKDILEQVAKLVSSSNQTHQILSLECLISGLPLLQDYEDELLPLVHRFWPQLVERFKQRDPIVLNRCFTLLNLTALYAKEFIAKRSLDDVIPFLKNFLKEAATHSQGATNSAQTQEYKLQIKLLRYFPNFIQCIQIEEKHFNEISEAVCLYLSEDQPKDLQNLAENYFKNLCCYNAPLLYLVVVKKSHSNEFKSNVDQIFKIFKLK